MNTSNSIDLVAVSDNQPTLRVEKEALLKVLVRELDSCTPPKVLQLTEQMVNEVIFESDVDGVHYYVVRCGQPTKLVCDEILLSAEQPNQTSLMKAEERINLSPREVAIAKLVARGLPNKSIAIHLHISPWTVATHLRRIFVKLGVTSRTAMITRLLEKNLLHD